MFKSYHVHANNLNSQVSVKVIDSRFTDVRYNVNNTLDGILSNIIYIYKNNGLNVARNIATVLLYSKWNAYSLDFIKDKENRKYIACIIRNYNLLKQI